MLPVYAALPADPTGDTRLSTPTNGLELGGSRGYTPPTNGREPDNAAPVYVSPPVAHAACQTRVENYRNGLGNRSVSRVAVGSRICVVVGCVILAVILGWVIRARMQNDPALPHHPGEEHRASDHVTGATSGNGQWDLLRGAEGTRATDPIVSREGLAADARAVHEFKITGATVAELLLAFREGRTTCTAVVRAYLDRIKAYDSGLRSVITVNEHGALVRAAELDRLFASSDGTGLAGPLHCVPLVAKDCYDHVETPTTAGSVLFKGCRPRRTGVALRQMEAAGAVLIAKTNMPDFTIGDTADTSGPLDSTSTVLGTTLNAYNPTRLPYGSSSGTGAAIAASLGLLGLAEDTQGSIQMPAAAEGMVGVRPTQGLISGEGTFPLMPLQDTAGPIARTAADAAAALAAMVDPGVARRHGVDPAGYSSGLGGSCGKSLGGGTPVAGGRPLEGLRVGFSRDVFDTVVTPYGTVIAEEEAVRAVNRSLSAFTALGARVVDGVNIARPLGDLLTSPRLAAVATCGAAWNRKAITEYLARNLDEACPIKSLDDIITSGVYHPGGPVQTWLAAVAGAPTDPADDATSHCDVYRASKEQGKKLVLEMMAAAGVDLVLYPVFNRLPSPVRKDPGGPINVPITYLSASTGLPSVTFPVGYAPDGTPVALSLTGPAYSEAALLCVAHAYETNAQYGRHLPPAYQ